MSIANATVSRRYGHGDAIANTGGVWNDDYPRCASVYDPVTASGIAADATPFSAIYSWPEVRVPWRHTFVAASIVFRMVSGGGAEWWAAAIAHPGGGPESPVLTPDGQVVTLVSGLTQGNLVGKGPIEAEVEYFFDELLSDVPFTHGGLDLVITWAKTGRATYTSSRRPLRRFGGLRKQATAHPPALRLR